jgi:hypothetical protein
MKMIRRSVLQALAGIALLTATHLSAQSVSVTVKWTLQKQDYANSTFINGVYNDKVLKLKVTTKDILDLIAQSFPTNFPDGFPCGSSLMLVDYSYFQVRDPYGYILLDDAWPFLTYADDYAQTNYLYKGKEYTYSGQQNYTYIYDATIYFDNPDIGISFWFDGIAQEKYSQSPINSSGYRTYQDSLSVKNGHGTGYDADGYLVLTGNINSSKAKWTDVP